MLLKLLDLCHPLMSRQIGKLTLLASRAADTGGPFSEPIDEDITANGRFLYVVSPMGALANFTITIPPNSGTLKGYRIENDGSLTPVVTIDGFPHLHSGCCSALASALPQAHAMKINLHRMRHLIRDLCVWLKTPSALFQVESYDGKQPQHDFRRQHRHALFH